MPKVSGTVLTDGECWHFHKWHPGKPLLLSPVVNPPKLVIHQKINKSNSEKVLFLPKSKTKAT